MNSSAPKTIVIFWIAWWFLSGGQFHWYKEKYLGYKWIQTIINQWFFLFFIFFFFAILIQKSGTLVLHQIFNKTTIYGFLFSLLVNASFISLAKRIWLASQIHSIHPDSQSSLKYSNSRTREYPQIFRYPSKPHGYIPQSHLTPTPSGVS